VNRQDAKDAKTRREKRREKSEERGERRDEGRITAEGTETRRREGQARRL
jgi:hypothetical protein